MPHVHELIDWCVGVFIVKDAKVLLLKHKKFGCWLCPGGHVELHENPSEAALREVKEETGFDIEITTEPLAEFGDPRVQSLHRPRFVDIHDVPGTSGTPTHRHIGLTYFARVIGGTLTLEEAGADDIGWFTNQQVSDMEMFACTRHYALTALKELNG